MVSTEIDLRDPNIEYKYSPRNNTHEEIFGEGEQVVELEYHFTVPTGVQRKLKVTAVLLGVD